MPRTMNEGFTDFLRKLTPSASETEAAKGHRKSIQACLENEFGMSRFFRTGSFGHGTSISGYSDVDYFASIPTSNLTQNSATTLAKVRSALDGRFPDTGVRVSCPSVIVPFGTDAKESTEVVPADLVNTSDFDGEKFLVYDIPDCSNGWMKASPELHAHYVRKVDSGLKGKVRPLIRFVKAWKYYLNVPISSFYLELRTTKFVQDMELIVYSYDLRSLIRHLSNLELAKMQDPMGISGYISPCNSASQLEEVKSKLATALSRANKAREAEAAENIKDAFYWWNKFFGGNFPSYYK